MYKPRQLSDLTPAGEVALSWDGPQEFTGYAGNSPLTLATEMAWWRGNWMWCGFRKSLLMPANFDMNQLATLGTDGTYFNAETPATCKLKNIDNAGWNFACTIRFRHLNNDTASVLFGDGHVEARKVGTITWNEMSYNFR